MARSRSRSTRRRPARTCLHCAQAHVALTYDHSGAVGTWTKSELTPGQALREPAPLFKKLDDGVVEEEYARLAG